MPHRSRRAGDGKPKARYKELRLNIVVQRRFGNAIVVHLVPLLVVVLLLFAQILTVSDGRERTGRLGFSVSNTIAICAALFFVVVLAHIQVRSQFEGSRIVYIEYFYYITYGLIVLTTVNAFVFSSGDSFLSRAIRHRENLVVRLLYWPVSLWAMAGATLCCDIP